MESDGICYSSIIISPPLPVTLWVGWQGHGRQSKPIEKNADKATFPWGLWSRVDDHVSYRAD